MAQIQAQDPPPLLLLHLMAVTLLLLWLLLLLPPCLPLLLLQVLSQEQVVLSLPWPVLQWALCLAGGTTRPQEVHLWCLQKGWCGPDNCCPPRRLLTMMLLPQNRLLPGGVGVEAGCGGPPSCCWWHVHAGLLLLRLAGAWEGRGRRPGPCHHWS